MAFLGTNLGVSARHRSQQPLDASKEHLIVLDVAQCLEQNLIRFLCDALQLFTRLLHGERWRKWAPQRFSSFSLHQSTFFPGWVDSSTDINYQFIYNIYNLNCYVFFQNDQISRIWSLAPPSGLRWSDSHGRPETGHHCTQGENLPISTAWGEIWGWINTY